MTDATPANAPTVATPAPAPSNTLLNPVITPEIRAQLESKIEKGYADQAEVTSTSAPVEEWFVDEGIKGVGKKPGYLLPKYKTLAEQAKAYPELQSRFGEFKGAPETYTLPEGVSAEDPTIKEFLDFSKKAGASQEVVAKNLEFYLKTQKAPEIDTEKERAALIAQDPTILERVNKGMSKVFGEDMSFWNNIPQFKMAEGIKKLDQIFSKIPQVSPVSPTLQNVTPTSVAEINSKVDYEKYKSDPVYRQQIESLYQRVGRGF